MGEASATASVLQDQAHACAELECVLARQRDSFAAKVFHREAGEDDLLMQAFGIGDSDVAANRQYWSRELGMCWERLVARACSSAPAGFRTGGTVGGRSPFDFAIGRYAVDAKYRVGSGDAKTLAGFRQNGAIIRELGLEPVVLVLRTDSLPAAMSAFAAGGWSLRQGDGAFDFVREHTNLDLGAWLSRQAGRFRLSGAT